MNNEWKDFFKENAFLFLVFFVIVFGFVGLTVYNGIRDTRLNNEKYETQLPEEMPLVIRSYEANEYKVITKSDQELAEYYLKQSVTYWYNDPGKLYDLMTDKEKNEYSSREEAVNRLTKLRSSKVLQSKVDAYKVEVGVVTILSDQGIEFKLSTNGINDYKISFMGQV